MAGIFINYRRADSRADAARIYDRLIAAFGRSAVFMDVDNLRVGQRFDRQLQKALNKSDVFLSVIGTHWVELLQQRQASGEPDLVHVEITEALKQDIPIIPVLIEPAEMPKAAAMPPDIQGLVSWQGHTLAHETFGRDMQALIEDIKATGSHVSKPSRAFAVFMWLYGAVCAFFALGLAANRHFEDAAFFFWWCRHNGLARTAQMEWNDAWLRSEKAQASPQGVNHSSILKPSLTAPS